jgi:hypothetical protein
MRLLSSSVLLFLILSACSSTPVRNPAMIGGKEMQYSPEVFLAPAQER